MNLIPDVLIMIVVVLLLGGVGLFFWLRRRPKTIKTDYFQREWRTMQKLCGSKDTWPQAIIAADDLLDNILKKKRFSGKSMGERLTHAQRLLTNNEGVWFGHKLRNRIDDDPTIKLKESEVKQALVGIRQAMKDLGAFTQEAAKGEGPPSPTPTPEPASKAATAKPKRPAAKSAPTTKPSPTTKPTATKSARTTRPTRKELKK